MVGIAIATGCFSAPHAAASCQRSSR
jgi:hypothetical protein